MERTTPITISDEEQPTGEITKDTDEPRQTIAYDEPPITTNAETTAVSEEQPPREAGVTTEADVAVDHPVDTGDWQDPEPKENNKNWYSRSKRELRNRSNNHPNRNRIKRCRSVFRTLRENVNII